MKVPSLQKIANFDMFTDHAHILREQYLSYVWKNIYIFL